jgi:hypothetical protein
MAILKGTGFPVPFFSPATYYPISPLSKKIPSSLKNKSPTKLDFYFFYFRILAQRTMISNRFLIFWVC